VTTAALNDDFRDMIAALSTAGVEFLIVGAHPLAAYGLPRGPATAWATKIEITIDGLTVHVIGRDQLLRNKRATGRDKDLVDVRALEKR
jgi:hypothetical protein